MTTLYVLIRPDGRLKYMEVLCYDMRYPIILPRKQWVTKLIVKSYHEKGEHNSRSKPCVVGNKLAIGDHCST